MKRWLILALLTACCSAQSILNSTPRLPVIQAKGNPANTATFDFPGISGTTLIAVSQWFSSAATPSVSDVGAGSAHRCASWTQLVPPSTAAGGTWISIYGCAASAVVASDVVTFSVSGASFQTTAILEIPAFWGITVDAYAASTYTGAPATIACPNVTTTVNGDFLICGVSGFFGNAWAWMTSANWLQYMLVQTSDAMAAAVSVGDSAGSQTGGTFNSYNMNQGPLVTLSLKPTSSIALTSDATAPDGALSNSYSWSLQAVGGAGAYTYACSGIPGGLSLNTSTGAITGTPASSNNYTLSCTVTDGTLTSTPKSIALKVGASLNTITLSQSNYISIGLATNTLAFSGSVTSGQLLLVSNAYTGNKYPYLDFCTDTVGTVYYPVSYSTLTPDVSGGNPSHGGQLWAGFAPSSGANTVTCSYQIEAISAWDNVSYIGTDSTALTTGTSVGSGNVTSSNFTPLVPSMVLFAQGIDLNGNPMTPQSPLTALDGSSPQQSLSASYKLLSTVTTYTATYAQGGTGTWGIALSAFRPTAGAVVISSSQIGAFLAGP